MTIGGINMFISRLLKGIMIGTCISIVSTGAAFAATTEDSRATKSMDTVVEDALLEKQKEVDQSVFVDNVDKIKEMGFTVAFTGLADSYVEIGITPYKEEFAGYLYEEFGKDEIKVVEGEEAMLYTTTTTEDDVIAVEDSSKMAESGIGELAPNAGVEESVQQTKETDTEKGNNNSWLITAISVVGSLILIVLVIAMQNKKKIRNRK